VGWQRNSLRYAHCKLPVGGAWSFAVNRNLFRFAPVLLVASAATVASHAESLVSSASSAGSASVGSLSQSVTNSSNSSSGEKKVADGPYKVIEVAAAPGRPELLRVQMRRELQEGAAAASTLWLELPPQALAARPLRAGDVVNVLNRPYGLRFAHAATREAFFLALADDWRGELDIRAVTL
jgi:hypothetical protein